MILKEAYRYQNFLTDRISSANAYLSNVNFTTTIKKVHHRNKVNKEAEDEIEVVQKSPVVDFTPNDVLNFLVKAIDEKEKLCEAIYRAKINSGIDEDSAVSMNKIKQNEIKFLSLLVNTKSDEAKVRGTDYKFNADGNQITYAYDIDRITTIDFDRNDVKNLIKKYNKEIDETSAKLDEILVTTEVDFVPTWDLHDSLEDILG